MVDGGLEGGLSGVRSLGGDGLADGDLGVPAEDVDPLGGLGLGHREDEKDEEGREQLLVDVDHVVSLHELVGCLGDTWYINMYYNWA